MKLNARNYFRKGQLWGRDEILKLICECLADDEGELIMLLGGKSLGKSILRNAVIEKLESQGIHTLLLDGRAAQTKHFAQELFKAVSNDKDVLSKLLDALPDFRKAVDLVPLNPAAKVGFEVTRDIFLNMTKKGDISLNDALNAFVKAWTIKNKVPCIVVDEATSFFPDCYSRTPDGKLDKTSTPLVKDVVETHTASLNALASITSFTKEKKLLNVLMISSEFLMPYRLQELGFRTTDIQNTFFMPEVSPMQMKVLLNGFWGMDHELANAFINVYGGNINLCYYGLLRLIMTQDAFQPIHALSLDALLGASQAAKRAKVDPVLKKYLMTLVEKGVVELADSDDDCARLLCLLNVAAVIPVNSIAPGVHPAVWPQDSTARFMLVPTNEVMRMLLANELG
jgi:hypothetical protein